MIDKEYSQKLNDYHENYFMYEKTLPTLLLNGDENIFDKEVSNRWIQNIDHFIYTSKIILNTSLKKYKVINI